ncbi:MAG: ABC-F family ATP-binding cassette domain-containing protein [Bosea sp. (in: a-proteobacteria)]
MPPPLLTLDGIGLTFGGAPLLEAASLSVEPGERLALVGRNGSGKSTLMKIAAAQIEADHGTRFIHPRATLRYMPQEPDLAGFASVEAYVLAGLQPGDDPYRAALLLEELGLTGQENPAALSGGELRRAAIAAALAPDPDILLIDEPTNHLDLPSIEWLEQALLGRKGALVLISHDRRFLDRLAQGVVWLDQGRCRKLDIPFSRFEERRDAILAEEEMERHKLDRKIVAEEHWLRYGVTARRKRNVRRLGDLMALRTEKREGRRALGKVEMAAAEAEASGKLVIEASNITKSFGERPLVKGFSIRVKRGERIGIVGPNGAGKTTLIRILTGELPPDSGDVKLGVNLDIATLDQKRDSLDPNWTLSDALTGGRGDQVMVGGVPRHVIGYMKDFLFRPEQARTTLSALSGGERGRLTLARALAKPSNMMVLDEPTNDLDLETLDVLEEMIAEYQGTVLLISHDRDFLDRAVDSVIAPEGDGIWRAWAGGYSDMLRQRGAEPQKSTGNGARGVSQLSAAPAAPQALTQRRKLSFKDKHALETLPAEMDLMTRRIAALQTILDDPGLYARDRKRFDEANAKLADESARLAAAEERWLELEMLREEIEAG